MTLSSIISVGLLLFNTSIKLYLLAPVPAISIRPTPKPHASTQTGIDISVWLPLQYLRHNCLILSEVSVNETPLLDIISTIFGPRLTMVTLEFEPNLAGSHPITTA